MKLFFCSVALVVMSAGCRSGDLAVSDAAVEPANAQSTGPAHEGTLSPNAVPNAIGGGPIAEDGVYATSTALNVLLGASCRCDATAECRDKAAARYAEILGRCGKAVGARMLAACATHENSVSCDQGAQAGASADACTAPALCEVGP